MMSRILVPLDGSPASDRAVKHVVSKADSRADVEIHLLHVQPALLPQDAPEIARPGLGARLASDDLDRTFGTARRALEQAGIRYITHHVHGDAAHEIAFYADIHGCDEIVMGTRGLGSIRNLLMGSVATKVLHLVKVPVTLVK
jgi:nucleotide-binding universal stress UspA family protein